MGCLLILGVLILVPNVIVNGQTSTGTISGTVICGAGCDTVGLSFGQPINVAGKVYAQMSEQLDPYTGFAVTMCPSSPPGQSSWMSGCVNGQTSFGASANGHYELQGLQPGIYTLYASAQGFPVIVFASGVTVNPGQSLTIDAFVCTSSGFVNGNCSQTPSNPTPEFPSGTSVIVAIGIILALSIITRHKKKSCKIDFSHHD